MPPLTAKSEEAAVYARSNHVPLVTRLSYTASDTRNVLQTLREPSGAIALAIACAAVALSALLVTQFPWLSQRGALPLLLGTVLATCWAGGWQSGAFATVLSTILALFYLNLHEREHRALMENWGRLTIFVTVAVAIVYRAAVTHRALRTAYIAERRLSAALTAMLEGGKGEAGSEPHRLQIAIVTGPFYPVPPAPCGAVERRWTEMAKVFASLGHDVTVLCRRHQDTPRDDERVDNVRFVRRTRFVRSGRIWLDLIKDLFYSVRLLKLVPASDIIVTNVFWLPMLLKLFRGSAGPVLVNVARAPKRQMGLYRRADRLLAVSAAIQRQIISQSPHVRHLIRVVPNPVNTAVFAPPAVRRDYTAPLRTILYTGRIHPEKGLELLVDAFRIVHAKRPFLKLVIMGQQTVEAGGGGPAFVAAVTDRAIGLPVEIRQPVYDRAQLAAVLHNAHYYCYPSLAEKGESFGVAPLEAMATELPVVLSSLECFQDFCRLGENGLVFDHHAANPAQLLADTLLRLVDDPDLARQLGEAAAQTAMQFSYPAIAQRYLTEFADLLQTEVAPAAMADQKLVS